MTGEIAEWLDRATSLAMYVFSRGIIAGVRSSPRSAHSGAREVAWSGAVRSRRPRLRAPNLVVYHYLRGEIARQLSKLISVASQDAHSLDDSPPPAFERLRLFNWREAEMVATPADAPLMALLIEDDLADAELVALRLAPEPDALDHTLIRLIHVTSAAGACAALRRSSVQVIILDLTLPDAQGLEALYTVRKCAPKIPIIVLTGYSDQSMALNALRAGAQDYVLKPPPDGASFRRILRYALQRQQLTRELDAAVSSSITVAHRWRLLAELGKVLGEAKTRDAAIRNTATLLVPTAADCFVIFLAPEEGAPAVLEIKHVDESKGSALRARLRELLMPRAESAENDVRREAIALSASLMDEALQMSFASLGIAEGTVLPLSYGEQLRGFLLMVASMDRPDSAVDIEFCRSLAERFGLALEQSYLLRRAQLLSAARDRAVGIVSHDLGNSLSTIDICASALLDPDPPPEIEVRNMAELILRSVTWMRRIAADLLDNTSLEAGRLELDRHPTMVSDVVNATHAMFARAAEERELELVVEQSPDLPPVDADPDRLMQVLSNLVGNAVKFTPVGGRVVLSAKLVSDTPVDSNGEAREAPRSDARSDARAEASVRFSVTDTGPGIAPEDLAHVFDWFWHARGFGHGGRGLGLAIARGLVEAHQQQLHVDSAPGRGSTFWFTMPVAQAGQRVRDDPVAAER